MITAAQKSRAAEKHIQKLLLNEFRIWPEGALGKHTDSQTAALMLGANLESPGLASAAFIQQEDDLYMASKL